MKNYDIKKRNYQTLKNLDIINYNNKIFEILKNTNIDNINGKVLDILNLYKNMNIKKNNKSIEEIKKEQINLKKNIMTIIYEFTCFDNPKLLFDETFVKNNKNNCYLIIKNEKRNLTYLFKDDINWKERIEIKLCETKTITDMSYIFYYCKNLISLPDIHKWDTKNVKNMSSIFSGCSSLISLPDISKWDTKKCYGYVFNIFGLFFINFFTRYI